MFADSADASPMSYLVELLDDEIYESMEQKLRDQLPNEEFRVECIMNELRQQNFAAEYHTIDVVFNTEEIDAKTQAFLDKVNMKCLLEASTKDIVEYVEPALPFLVIIFASCFIVFCAIKCIKRAASRRVQRPQRLK